MAQRSWKESFFDIFRANGFRGGTLAIEKPHQKNLEFVKECLKSVQKKLTKALESPEVPVIHGQCQHLVQKLQKAVQSVEQCAYELPEVLVERVQIMDLLCRSADEITTIIGICIKPNWIEAALESASMFEYVASLCYDLDFCTLLYRSIHSSVGLEELAERQGPDEFLRAIVLKDLRSLRIGLVDLLESSQSDGESHLPHLAWNLSRKLMQSLYGVVDLRIWEIDPQNVATKRKLGNDVHESVWSGVKVAEKIFHGIDPPQFKSEVEILAGLAHPKIVPFLGYTVDGDSCSIIMKLMDDDLFHLIKEKLHRNRCRKFPFTIFEGVDMMLQIAEGMLYLHGKKVVHRDLKSYNILVTTKKYIDAEYTYVRVADFGLSKIKENSKSSSNLTTGIGTTRWMAPELYSRNENHVTTSEHDGVLGLPFKVDVYSFGMVCFEILTGQLPFAKVTLGEVKKKVVDGERPELPDYCFDDLKILISYCWDQEPSRRPSFREICKRLREFKFILMGGQVS